MGEDFSEIYGKILDKQIKENTKVCPVTEKTPEKIMISVKETKKEPLEKFLIELQEKLREKIKEKKKLEKKIVNQKQQPLTEISSVVETENLVENDYVDVLIKIDNAQVQEKKLIKENEDLSSQIQNLKSQITRLSVEGGTWGGGDIGGGGSIMTTSGGSGCVCLTGIDRLVADAQTLILNSDGTISFPNDVITTPTSLINVFGDLSATGKVYQNGNDLQSEIESVSAASQSVYTTVNTSSTYWDNVYTTFKNASSTFLTSETDSQTLSFNDALKTLSISSGNTVSLSSLVDSTSVDTSIRTLSSNWQSTYTTVSGNSANWNYQGSDIKSLTSGWVGGNQAYTNLIFNSAAYLSGYDLSFLSVSGNWNSAYTTVQTYSASWAIDSTTDTGVRALTSVWESTYTTVSSNSAYWGGAYTTLQANSATWGSSVAGTSQVLIAEVKNAETITLNRGDVVYAFGSTGNKLSVKLASNLDDTTSSKTIGIVNGTITAGGTGFITSVGRMDQLNLESFSEGDSLWLDTIAGDFTNVKPVAPKHGVFLGIVERANNGDGIAYIKIQNGYELNEIHDVLVTNVSAGDFLQRDSTNTLWIPVPLSASQWNSSYTTVQNNSATWGTGGGTSLSTVINYLSTSNVVLSSAQIGSTSTNTTLYVRSQKVGINTEAPNHALTIVGNVSATGLFYGDGSQLTGIVAGDTVATTLVRSNSANWQSTYTTVSSNSANWNYQGTDLKSLSANWQSTYTTFKNASSTFLTSETDSQTLSFNEGTKDLSISNGNTVSLSALIDGTGADTQVTALTSNWQSTYTNVQSNSATWDGKTTLSTVVDYLSTSNVLLSSAQIGGTASTTLYVRSQKVGINTEEPNHALTVVGNISATGVIYGDGSQLTGIVAGDTVATTLVRSNSANWELAPSIYTIVQTNSATNWNNSLANQYTHTNFLPLTGGNLTGAITTTSTISSSQTISASGARVITGLPSDSIPVYYITVLTQGEYDAIVSPDPNTLYFIKP